jgi:signal transduction histidine kinase
VATLYFPPEFRPMVSDIRDEVQLAVFAGATTSITLLVGAVRRAQETAERALAAYRRSQQEKELILSTLSHDLKNQLTAVESITFLQRRRLAGVEGEAVEGALTGFQRIDEVVTRLTTLVTQLEDTFRTESRRGELELEECDLVALLGQIADRCRQGTERHCIVVRAGTGSLVGRFDGSQLARVFENLISNAVKYSPDGGEITISVEREESEGKPGAVISVQDRGVGIPTADLPFIFEPRRRGSNVRDTAGTGLGLAGARRIVERHDGTITAESVEGEGTTVTVRLPIQPESERATIRLPTRAVRRA